MFTIEDEPEALEVLSYWPGDQEIDVPLEDADAIRSAREILAMGPAGHGPVVMSDWLPERRPLRVGVLAGASSPDVVVGGVLEALAELLS